MSSKTKWLVVSLSFLAGLSGGIASNWLFGSGVTAFAQQAQGVSKVLRTGRLEVVDKQGKVCATFEVLSSGYPRLHLGDTEKGTVVTTSEFIVKDGTEHALLGPLVGSSGALGRVGLTIMAENNSLLFLGAKGLSLVDRWGDARLSFAVVPERSYKTMFLMSDRGNKPRVVLGVGNDGSGSLGVHDRDGGVLWSIP